MDKLTYQKLKPGIYTFRIAILDGADGAVVESANYKIEKETEMYQNWWFKLYLAIVTVMIISYLTWLFFRTQLQKTLKMQKMELELTKKQLQMGNETIISIARTVDAKDPYTSQHSIRVAQYSVAIAKRYGFDDERCENLRQIGYGSHDGAGCGGALLNLNRADIEDADNGDVQDDVHHRPKEGEQHLDIELGLHEVAVGFVEAFLLALFLDEGLDHTDARDVLLDDAVEPVQALLQNSEERIGAPDHKDDVDENQRKGAGHDDAEAQIQREQRRRTADEEHQAADKAADHLHDELLDLRHVIGDAGDERAGRKVVRLLKGEVHNAVEAQLADFVSAALAGHVGKKCREQAAESARDDHKQHLQPGGSNKTEVGYAAAGESEDALIHDQRHHTGLVEIHIDLSDHEPRCQQRHIPVFFYHCNCHIIVFMVFMVFLLPDQHTLRRVEIHAVPLQAFNRFYTELVE